MSVQRFAYIIGGVYLAIGIVGFFLTGLADIARTEGETLILFDVNPLHNFAHLVFGAIWLAGATRPSTARSVSNALGGLLVVLGVVGFFLVGSSINILALNHPDNLLHIATGGLALFLGLTTQDTVSPAKI